MYFQGRGLVATRHIFPGEIIFVENPMVSSQFSINEADGFLCCNHCMYPLETANENFKRVGKLQDFRLLFDELDRIEYDEKISEECLQCGIQYCSENCRIRAWRSYHSAACMGMEGRRNMEHHLNKINNLWMGMHHRPETGTIKILIKIIAMYRQTTNKKEFLKKLWNFENPILDSKLLRNNRMFKPYSLNYFTSLRETFREMLDEVLLPSETEAFCSESNFNRLINLIGLNSVEVKNSSFEAWLEAAHQDPEMDHEYFSHYVDDIFAEADPFADMTNFSNQGSALYQIQSKINHSCSPNAQLCHPELDDFLQVKALQFIKPGVEITISYLTAEQLNCKRQYRQVALRQFFHFTCNCVKCYSESEPEAVPMINYPIALDNKDWPPAKST